MGGGGSSSSSSSSTSSTSTAAAQTQQQIEQKVPPATAAALRVIAANPSLNFGQAATQVNLILASYDIQVTAQQIELYRNARYANFFFSTRASVVQLETVEISHPAFSKIYRLVRNASKGITATIEGGGTADFEYYPMKIVPQHARDDLDQTISISFGDLGEVLPKEMDKVMSYPGGMDIKPTVKYRIYRSDDLSRPLYGPLNLEVSAFGFDRQGATFEARAPAINLTKTGEIYSVNRFPGLAGFV